MKRSTKLTLYGITLSVCILIVAVGTLAGYGYYRFRMGNEAARVAGVGFGKTTDNGGCVAESIRQFAEYKETSFMIRVEQSKIGHFNTGCLTSSSPTPKFCVGVPKPTAFLDSLQYTVKKCRDSGLPDGGPCNEIFKAVAVYCATKPDLN